MARNLDPVTHACAFNRFLLPQSRLSPGASGGGRVSKTVRCMTAIFGKPEDQTIVRRTANYKPPIWEYEYIQSLSNKYVGEEYAKCAAKRKEDVRMMLETIEEPLEKLELIDVVQRLGVSYHFENEIKRILDNIYKDIDRRSASCNKGNLYATALEYRLMRQHGYYVTKSFPHTVFSLLKKSENQEEEEEEVEVS